MSDERLFFINGNWYTYKQAHNLFGCTKRRPQMVTLYTSSLSPVVVIRDVDDSTFYYRDNHKWVSDISYLNLYKSLGKCGLYKGETQVNNECYSSSYYNTAISIVKFNSVITDLQTLYNSEGITQYKCAVIQKDANGNSLLDRNGNPLVWYDKNTKKYWVGLFGIKRWQTLKPLLSRMYNSYTNIGSLVYELSNENSIYTDNTRLTYESFYANDSYGIIRSTSKVYNYNNPVQIITCYYDSYSNEFCIPNVTDIWVSEEDLFSLYGYVVFTEYADFYLCRKPLHLLKRIPPNTAILSFTNLTHPELSIVLPLPITAAIGSSIQLPSMSDSYYDLTGLKWVPAEWDIGGFNSLYTLTRDTSADLLLNLATVSLSFINSRDAILVELPDNLLVQSGTTVTLPVLNGNYSDSDGLIWQPYSWTIGEFGDSLIIYDDTVADIEWLPVYIELSFSNTDHSDLDVQLPESITVQAGSLVTLPEVSGIYIDSNNIKWSPVRWSIGQFNSTVQLSSITVANLVLESISTYNVVNEDLGEVIHSCEIAIELAPIEASLQKDHLIQYSSISPVLLEDHAIEYAPIIASIQDSSKIVISSSESIPPADIILYNTETGEIYSSIFNKSFVTFIASYFTINEPDTDLVIRDTSYLTINNPSTDIYTSGTSSFTTNDILDTILVNEVSYEDIVLYLPCGLWQTYYYQEQILSSFSGTIDNGTLYTLYTDTACTVPATYDSSKTYEIGHFTDGEWIPENIQSVSNMPSQPYASSPLTYAKIIINDNGEAKLWFITNYTYSGQSTKLDYQYDSNATYTPFYFRVYSSN